MLILLRVKIDLGTRNGQIAFHINPRFGQGCIVRNSQLNGWGAEEKSGSFPFQKGRAFEIVILVEDDKYKVEIFKFLAKKSDFFSYDRSIKRLPSMVTTASTIVTDAHIKTSVD
jgi:hypothetical protein